MHTHTHTHTPTHTHLHTHTPHSSHSLSAVCRYPLPPKPPPSFQHLSRWAIVLPLCLCVSLSVGSSLLILVQALQSTSPPIASGAHSPLCPLFRLESGLRKTAAVDRRDRGLRKMGWGRGAVIERHRGELKEREEK